MDTMDFRTGPTTGMEGAPEYYHNQNIMTRQNGVQFFEGKISASKISSNTYIQGNLLPSATHNSAESHGSSGPPISLNRHKRVKERCKRMNNRPKPGKIIPEQGEAKKKLQAVRGDKVFDAINACMKYHSEY